MITKLGEAIQIRPEDIKDTDFVINAMDDEILEKFKKTAAELKHIAPKAKDFLYFTAIMMHAAEASIIDENGNIKKDAKGKPVKVWWDKFGDALVWRSSDPNVKAYKNSNGDIFPETELKKAYKNWIGKPLCLDHKSDSVDHIRGVIVDTYYDDKMKRIIALCALDKINYPDLARKISTGYAHCVSMGVGVGRAVCTEEGCHRVARIESEFCDHMRTKSCYGEINIDLSPIELSIVVNGADAKAKIRHIVAAANSIAKYVENKEDLINNTKEELGSDKIAELENSLLKAQEVLSQLKKAASQKDSEENEDENDVEDVDLAYGQHGKYHMDETNLDNTDRNIGGFPQRVASIDNYLNNLENRLNDLINKMASLESTNSESADNDNKDLEMTDKKDVDKKAYFQGGGGVNEPAPKQVKYEKENYQAIRDNQDKQMHPNPPDTGSVDGMFPGDQEKKRSLQRIAEEVENRRLRREAALEKAKQVLEDKKAYFQGGGGDNEPTPGKPKYPKEDYQANRDKNDKQMTGAKPFPDVGKLDGLYGDDLKKKQMLSRAKLNAKFIKAANPDGSDNYKESSWQVFADNKLILSASVGEIAGDKSETLYDSIATKEFGKKILSTIKTEGYDKAVSLFKKAQVESIAGPAAAPASPVDAGLAPEVPADFGMDSAPEEAVDTGETGDPMEHVKNLLMEVDNNVAEMKKALEALNNEDMSDLDPLASMDDEVNVTASKSVSLTQMRKTLNAALKKGFKQAIADLEEHKDELELLEHVYSNSESINNSNIKVANALRDEAVKDAKVAVGNVYKLMSSFVKYARGTDALVKKADEVSKLSKKAQTADEKPAEDPNAQPGAGATGRPGEAEDPHDVGDMFKDFKPEEAPDAFAPPTNMPPADMFADDSNDAKVNLETKELELEPQEVKDVLNVSDGEDEYDLSTKAGRAAARAKIAQKGLTFSDLLQKAHPGGGTSPNLGSVKPKDNLERVEDLVETHNKHMDVATATVKVRQAAEEIQRLVVAGNIDPKSDFPALIAEGLDPAAVKYWKQFWGEAKDGGSQFASELVKEYQKKKSDKEFDAYKVKFARAYELANDMAECGLIGKTKTAVNAQVEDIMNWPDKSFDSMNKIVANQKSNLKKNAMPNVGVQESMLGTSELILPAPPAGNTSSLRAELEAVFSTPLKRR